MDVFLYCGVAIIAAVEVSFFLLLDSIHATDFLLFYSSSSVSRERSKSTERSIAMRASPSWCWDFQWSDCAHQMQVVDCTTGGNIE